MRSIFASAAVLLLSGAFTAQGASAPRAGTVGPQRHLVVFDQSSFNSLGADRLIRASGAELVRQIPEIGAAVVQSKDPAAFRKLAQAPGVLGVAPERRHQFYAGADSGANIEVAKLPGGAVPSGLAPWTGRAQNLGRTVTAENLLQAPFFFFGFQWDLERIQAPAAWTAGALGDPGVTVAVIGSGVDYTHPELEGKVDLDRSINLVPEDAAMVQELFPGAHPIADLGLHGTFVSAMIACNAFGQACGAPNVTIVGVKVVDFEEIGTVTDLVLGILYAGLIHSDVIVLPEPQGKRNLDLPEDRLDVILIDRAVHFVQALGSLVLAPAWTDRGALGIDADHDGNQRLLPAESGATVVGFTGTEDQWSGISSFGFSLVDVAAPGGQVDLGTVRPPPGVFIFSVAPCSSFTQNTRFGPLPDVCNKTEPPQWIFSFGARPAVAHAASVAALIESRYGGVKRGEFVRSKLLGTADDVLTPGPDAYAGAGRVNALRAWTE